MIAWDKFDTYYRICTDCGKGKLWADVSGAPDRAIHDCATDYWFMAVLALEDDEEEI